MIGGGRIEGIRVFITDRNYQTIFSSDGDHQCEVTKRSEIWYVTAT